LLLTASEPGMQACGRSRVGSTGGTETAIVARF